MRVIGATNRRSASSSFSQQNTQFMLLRRNGSWGYDSSRRVRHAIKNSKARGQILGDSGRNVDRRVQISLEAHAFHHVAERPLYLVTRRLPRVTPLGHVAFSVNRRMTCSVWTVAIWRPPGLRDGSRRVLIFSISSRAWVHDHVQREKVCLVRRLLFADVWVISLWQQLWWYHTHRYHDCADQSDNRSGRDAALHSHRALQ